MLKRFRSALTSSLSELTTPSTILISDANMSAVQALNNITIWWRGRMQVFRSDGTHLLLEFNENVSLPGVFKCIWYGTSVFNILFERKKWCTLRNTGTLIASLAYRVVRWSFMNFMMLVFARDYFWILYFFSLVLDKSIYFPSWSWSFPFWSRSPRKRSVLNLFVA